MTIATALNNTMASSAGQSAGRSTLTVWARGAESGWRLVIDGGAKGEPEPAGAAPGGVAVRRRIEKCCAPAALASVFLFFLHSQLRWPR